MSRMVPGSRRAILSGLRAQIRRAEGIIKTRQLRITECVADIEMERLRIAECEAKMRDMGEGRNKE